MKANLSKRAVEAVKPAPVGDRYLWDAKLPGFGLKVTPHGRRVYVFQYSRHNRTRRITLGRHGLEFTAEDARSAAERLRGQIAGGRDPAAEQARARGIPSLSEFAEQYLSEHARPKKKPRSAAEDERNLRKHILPALGHIRLDALTRADVARFHAGLRATPGAANRCLALLSKMMSLAERWGLRPDGSNPTRHVDRYPERAVERYLSAAELAHLGEVLAEAEAAGEHPSAIAAVRLLIFTGCRRSEILTLQWAHVDAERACLRLPDSKTGAKLVPLGAPALQLLQGLPRLDGNPYVLPGSTPGRRAAGTIAAAQARGPGRFGHFVGLSKVWGRLRDRVAVRQWRIPGGGGAELVARLERELGREPRAAEVMAAAEAAGLELSESLRSARLHDLRHSFASAGAGMGESLYLVGSLLGHKTTATTKRYAHLSHDPLKASADRIAAHLAAQLQGRSAEVVPIRESEN